MKKVLILSLLTVVGCTEQNLDMKSTNYVLKEGKNPLEIVIIDSCEYLYAPWGNASVLTHKGNCKNPSHY